MELSKEQKIMQKVISKAWDEAAFKAELLANPIAAIQKLTGETISVPEGKTLQVFDQSNPNVICFNIPQKPNFDNVELTDSQLEAVAGGCYAILPGIIDQCWYPTKSGNGNDGSTKPGGDIPILPPNYGG